MIGLGVETPSRWNRVGQLEYDLPPGYVGPQLEPPSEGPGYEPPSGNGLEPENGGGFEPPNGNGRDPNGEPVDNGGFPPITDAGGLMDLAKKNPMITIGLLFLVARMTRII